MVMFACCFIRYKASQPGPGVVVGVLVRVVVGVLVKVMAGAPVGVLEGILQGVSVGGTSVGV